MNFGNFILAVMCCIFHSTGLQTFTNDSLRGLELWAADIRGEHGITVGNKSRARVCYYCYV